jgi:lipoprotein-anchoring transpeptidase ErfK/SrfK
MPQTVLAMKIITGLLLPALLLTPDATPTPHKPSVIQSVSRGTDSYRASRPTTASGSRQKDHSLSIGVKAKSRRFTVFPRPEAPARLARKIAAHNPIDQKLVVLVRKTRTVAGNRWHKVLLPERPNGSRGWVRARDVSVIRLHQTIKVDLSERALTYFRKGRRVGRYTVAIGTPSTPTPTGAFYVWARVSQTSPQGPYGVYALGLSGFSVLSEWPGGGRAAIHGTAISSDAGAAVSHGCLRVQNADMRHLMGVPMGTPVTIHA